MCSLQQQFKRLEQSLTDRLDQHAQVNMQQFALMLQAITANKADSKDSMITTDVQHRHQRARLTDDLIPALARNEVLDTIFSFVGIGEYYYIAGVCRNWRGRYLTFCHHTPAKQSKDIRQPYTSCSSIVATAARLQLALDNGLTVAQLQAEHSVLSDAIAIRSLEPRKVITLARLYGMQWSDHLTYCAAYYRQYELLKWLHKCGCPWDLEDFATEARETQDLEHTKQLFAVTAPWPADKLTILMQHAALYDNLDTIKWLHEQGTEWPTRFYDNWGAPDRDCWSLECAQWAVANGSTWLEWRCQDLANEYYHCRSTISEHAGEACRCTPACPRKQASALLQWAHENGCPCTCNEAAAAAL
jgi:hypothetical protein